jgi:hypothetical protein
LKSNLALTPLIALALILGLWQCSYAQTFKPGLLAGLTTSQVGGDGYSGFNKLGVTAGGFVRYNLREKWSAQFEIYFVQKGSRNAYSISENDPTQSSEYFICRLNYVEVPLMIKFNHRRFVYEAGLYYAQLIGFYMEYRNDDRSIPSQVYNNITEFNSLAEFYNYEPFLDSDFGGLLGFGYKISENILGGIRISNSVTPIKKHDSNQIDRYPTQLNIGWTNTVIAGTLRYTFGQGDE